MPNFLYYNCVSQKCDYAHKISNYAHSYNSRIILIKIVTYSNMSRGGY